MGVCVSTKFTEKRQKRKARHVNIEIAAKLELWPEQIVGIA